MIDLSQNDEIGCSVGLENEDNFFKWAVVFEGPSDTLYEVIIAYKSWNILGWIL